MGVKQFAYISEITEADEENDPNSPSRHIAFIIDSKWYLAKNW